MNYVILIGIALFFVVTAVRNGSTGWDFNDHSMNFRVGDGDYSLSVKSDGDVDLLMTTNNGPAVLFRNDQETGNRSLRFRLTGTTSNRDAIGATVRIFHDGTSQSRMVRSGSSYLSQSELPVTFGVGKRDRVDRVVLTWPNGRTEEFKNVAAGKAYDCVEGKGIIPA